MCTFHRFHRVGSERSASQRNVNAKHTLGAAYNEFSYCLSEKMISD